MIARTKIAADSPDPQDRTAHLKPLFDYFTAGGNLPKHQPPFDQGTNNQGFSACYMQKIFDWREIEQLFDFPDSIVLSPKFGIIRDEAHALDIIEGTEE